MEQRAGRTEEPRVRSHRNSNNNNDGVNSRRDQVGMRLQLSYGDISADGTLLKDRTGRVWNGRAFARIAWLVVTGNITVFDSFFGFPFLLSIYTPRRDIIFR